MAGGRRAFGSAKVAGSAECQSSAFAVLSTDGSIHVLNAPQGYTAPCWNMQGNLGTVLGHPAYIEYGTVSPTTDDSLTRVTPWTGGGWGRACEVTVELTHRFKIGRQFCGNPKLCRAASAIAADVASEYLRYRQQPTPSMQSIGPDEQVPHFEYGQSEPLNPRGSTVVADAWHLLARQNQTNLPGAPVMYGTYASVFPKFEFNGPNDGWDYSFSYVDFAFFPLILEGQLYLGAVAHNGVAWREGPRTLVAVYEAPQPGQRELIPLAGIAVERISTGLKGTTVARSDTARSAPP